MADDGTVPSGWQASSATQNAPAAPPETTSNDTQHFDTVDEAVQSMAMGFLKPGEQITIGQDTTARSAPSYTDVGLKDPNAEESQ
jgi:hypothetical protein